MKRVERVNVGRTAGPDTPESGVAAPVTVHLSGLEGDRPVAPEAEGSLARAIWAYPFEHYPFWQTVRSQAGLADWGMPLSPGALGESLTLVGLVEAQAFVGDVLRFPGCTLAISGPRFPGDELNARVGFPHAARLMTQSAWCGFWLAVRVPGVIASGEAFELIPGPREVGITELFRARADRR
jgi:MOSC domain-containing protein YiiM